MKKFSVVELNRPSSRHSTDLTATKASRIVASLHPPKTYYVFESYIGE